jgi:hypothetical protein
MKRLALTIVLGVALIPLPAAAATDQLYDIAILLSGSFEGSTPGNHLNLNLQTLANDPDHPYNQFVQVAGKFENDNVRLQGVIQLERQGQDVYFTYIPHFNPMVSSLSNDAGHFTERELTSACSFVMKPKGDGFIGETLGTTTCAMAIRGAIGKWSLEIEPGNMRIRNTDSGQTLRFQQTGKAEKTPSSKQ